MFDAMKTYLRPGLVLASILIAGSTAFAASGTWSTDSDGNWSDPGKWSGGTVADGAGFSADFSTVNITGNRTVTLDTAGRIIGALRFADATTASHDWLLTGNPLTLQVASGTPGVFVVNRTAVIGLPLQGTQGLIKSNAGTLMLTGNNTYSGLTTIATDGGMLILSNTAGVAVQGDIQLGNAATGNDAFLQLGASEQIADSAVITFTPAGTRFGRFKLMGNTETVAGISDSTTRGIIENTELETTFGSTVGLLVVSNTADYSFNGYFRDARSGGSGKVALTKDGPGSLTLAGGNITYSQPTLVKQGALILTNTTTFTNFPTILGGRLQLVGRTVGQYLGITNNAPNGLAFEATNDFVVIGLSGTGTVLLEKLDGGGINLNVGNLNSNSLFSGSLTGQGSLTKIGSGTFTLSGTNTYAGTTVLNGGYLAVQNDQALSGTSGIFATNAALRLEGGVTIANKPITIVGQGPGSDTSGILQAQTGANVWTGPIILGQNLARIGAQPDATLTVSGGIESGANPFSLAIRCSNLGGTILLNSECTHLGQTHLVVGTLKLGGDDRLPFSSILTNGNTANQGSAVFDLNGYNQELAGLTALGTTMPVSVTNSAETASALSLNVADVFSFRGPIQGNLAFYKFGVGTQTLAAVNTYLGDTTISAGTLKLGSHQALPDGAGKGNVIVNGTLDLAGFSDTINGLSGAGTVNNSGAGAVSLTVGGADATSTFSGLIQNSGGALSLVKTGAGVLTLGGPNTYTGPTTIAAGTLALTAGGSINQSPAIAITPGAVLNVAAADSFAIQPAQILTAGRATGFAPDIVGNLTNQGAINVAGIGVAGTLTINGGLTLAGGQLSFELSDTTTAGGGTNDLISINGVLDLSTPTVVNVTFINGSPAVGVYTLIGGGTAVAGNPANLSLNWPSESTRLTAYLDATTAPGSVLLHVEGSGAALTWTGANSSVWDLGLSTNWDNAGLADRFLNFDNVQFTDASTNGTVNLTGSLIPASVVVSNQDLAYTFGGSGKISGGASLAKTGGGLLVINNSNDFAGQTLVNGGTLRLGNVAALGSAVGATFVTNGGTLDLGSQLLTDEPVVIAGAGVGGQGALINSDPSFTANYGLKHLALAADATIGGQGRFDLKNNPVVEGNGHALTKVGTNAVNINGAGETGLGAIHVQEGMLQVEGNSLLGNPAETLTVAAGAKFGFYNSTVTNNKAVAIDGGSLWVRNANGALGGAMTLTDTATFQVDGANLILAGPIGGPGGFVKQGAGNLYLQGAGSSWAGGALLSAGNVFVGASEALVGPVTNQVTLTFTPATNTVIACPASIAGPGSLVQPNTALGTTVFTGSNVVEGSVTVSGGTLAVGPQGSLAGNVTVNSAALRVDDGGWLRAGSLTIGQNVINSSAAVLPGGNISIGEGPTNNLAIGIRSINTSIQPRGALDASGASQLVINVGSLLVGVSTENSTQPPPAGTLRLATNNLIVATNILIGDIAGGGGYNDNAFNEVRLGAGSNIIHTPVLTVGGKKMSARMILEAGGTLTLDNDALPADLVVGASAILTGAKSTNVMDLSAGAFVASLNNVVIGQKSKGPDANSGSGFMYSSVLIGTNAASQVSANSLLIGSLLDAGTGVANGSLTVGGGTFAVNGNVTLAEKPGAATAVGTLTLQGGVFSVAGDVLDAGGSSALVLDGGTLDLQPAGDPAAGTIGTLANPVDNLALRGGILRNVAEINGGGALAKTGAGTLVIEGANGFTGALTVQEGALLVNGEIAGGGVNVQGGLLGGVGIINGPVTVQATGEIKPGASIGVLTISNTLTLAGQTTMEINPTNTPACDLVRGVTALNLGGVLTVVNTGGPLLGGEVFKLFDAGSYAGAFAAFNLPALTGNLSWDTSRLGVDGTLVVLTNLPPVAVDDNLGAVAGIAVQISSGKLLTNDSDPDGNPLVIVSVGTAAHGLAELSPDGQVVTYGAFAGYSGPDSFTYTISDGAGGQATATVHVSVTAGGEGFNRVGIETLAGGSVKLSYQGIPYRHYALDWAHSLSAPINWLPLFTNQAGLNGAFGYTNAPSGGNDFYRTREVP